MTRPAQAFKVAVFISTAVGLRFDVIHAGRLLHDSLTKMVLTQPFVSLQYAGSYDFPLRSISALLSGLSRFIGFPALAFVIFTVARWVCCGKTAAANTAGFWCSWRHICSNKKATSGCQWLRDKVSGKRLFHSNLFVFVLILFHQM